MCYFIINYLLFFKLSGLCPCCLPCAQCGQAPRVPPRSRCPSKDNLGAPKRTAALGRHGSGAPRACPGQAGDDQVKGAAWTLETADRMARGGGGLTYEANVTRCQVSEWSPVSGAWKWRKGCDGVMSGQSGSEWLADLCRLSCLCWWCHVS